jgi:hypothetical protein
MTEGGRQLDQAAAERLLSTGEKVQWQHVRDYDRQQQDVEKFGSKASHLTVVGVGWAAIVGSSVAKSLLDPSKRHLQLSHRLIHARIVAQWCDAPRPAPLIPPTDTDTDTHTPTCRRQSIAHLHSQRRHTHAHVLILTLPVRACQGDDRCADRGWRRGEIGRYVRQRGAPG